ncbi:MAG: sulfatase [Myxococcales bacterium]
MTQPPLLGALYLVILALRAATQADADELTLGRQARQIVALVQLQFHGEIARIGVAIVSVAFVLGALLGALAGGLVWLRGKTTSAKPAWRVSLEVLAVTALLHAFIELRAMAVTPQLYADAFYAQGGLHRTVQVLATDVLGPTGITLLGLLLTLTYMAGPPSVWPRWPARIRFAASVVRKRLRRGGAAASTGAVGGAASLLVLGLLQARAESPQMNVLILAADSLRADRLTPDVAPNLLALASRGTRFDKAYVSLPRTFPSWVTFLTGRHPHHHGIRTMFPRWDDRAKDFDALPARFAKAGYSTAVVSDYAGDIFGRIDLGFRWVDVPAFDFRQLVRQRALERQTPLLPFLHSRLGRRVFPVLRELNHAADPKMLNEDVFRALDRVDNAPFFLTVFYSTAHFPYAAPSPYYRKFTQPSYRGRFKYHKPVGLGRDAPPDDSDVQQIRALYDGAVSSVDDAIADVLADLQRRGLLERTIVVVTADHGETLFENGHGQGHGDHLFGDEATHVPLLIIDPRSPVRSHVELGMARDVDLAPTLYELTGIPAPSQLDGRSLAPALRGKPLPHAFAYAESELWFTEEIPGVPPDMRLPYPGIARLTELDPQHNDEIVLQRALGPITTVARHRMVRDERYKLVYVPARSGVRYLLFDTERDPAETKDIATDRPDLVHKLKGELWSWMLRDTSMMERGGYLLPRDLAALVAPSEPGVRLGDIPADEPAADGAP